MAAVIDDVFSLFLKIMMMMMMIMIMMALNCTARSLNEGGLKLVMG